MEWQAHPLPQVVLTRLDQLLTPEHALALVHRTLPSQLY